MLHYKPFSQTVLFMIFIKITITLLYLDRMTITILYISNASSCSYYRVAFIGTFSTIILNLSSCFYGIFYSPMHSLNFHFATATFANLLKIRTISKIVVECRNNIHFFSCLLREYSASFYEYALI